MNERTKLEQDHPGVAKVKEMWERGDFKTIDKMVELFEAFEKLGFLGGLLRRFIVWSGVIVVAYLAVYGHIADWIRSVVAK